MSTTHITATDVKQHLSAIDDIQQAYRGLLGKSTGRITDLYMISVIYGVSYDYAKVCLDHKLDPSTALTTHPELFI